VDRLGIFGGTFNPPHLAHLVCASEAAEDLQLDVVLFTPVGVPPHKDPSGECGAEHRFRMCELATRDDDRLGVSRLEIDRGGPSYTVDTLREIHAAEPDQELTFIVGGDQAHGFPSWRDPEAVLSLATLAVAERDGTRREDIAERLAPLHQGDRVRFFDMPRLDLSSSDIRRRVRDGRSIRYLVLDPVREYIERCGLYRSSVHA
jgi:nicotinate-nucleotide adenylyltransferase